MVSHSTQMLVELLGRTPNFSLPQKFYTDPEFHRLDMEHIWYRDWLFAGHDCEIPKAGDYFTMKVGDYPITVVRGSAGEIRAFHNVCRHRGQQICMKAKGSGAKLVCPYHQWTYDLDGRLLFARDMMKSIDTSRFGLKSVACESFAGYIFICLADEPASFETFRDMALPYMAPHKLTDAKVAFESSIVEQGNWKLVMENNRECYHCAGNHPELGRTFTDRPTLTGVDGLEGDGIVSKHWEKCEQMGLPSRFKIADDAQYRVTRVPLLNDGEAMTLSGKAAVAARPLADFPSMALGSMLLFHYPSSWNHMMADHAISFRMLPISATETELTTKWLVHKDAVEGKDYDLKTLTEVWMATNDEDRRVVEWNQKGILSPAYEPGPYSELHEGGVIQFVDWYVNAIVPRLKSVANVTRHVA
jgi:Rieske 2Fe-2S family protein